MSKAPAFQWYPKDILASVRVAEMSLSEEGAYRRLIDYCWLHGSIPSDPKRCARLIGKDATPEIAEVALSMFTVDKHDETRMIHDRLDEEREKQARNSKARKRASDSRWKNKTPQSQADDNDANGMQMECKTDANASGLHDVCIDDRHAKSSLSSPSPSSTAVIKRERERAGDEAVIADDLQTTEFDGLWNDWLAAYFAHHGRKLDSIRQQHMLMDLSRRGLEKALRDLRFSLVNGWHTRIADSDMDKPKASGGGAQRSIGKSREQITGRRKA